MAAASPMGLSTLSRMTLPWRHKNLALPVTQFTGPDAPRSHITLGQRVPMASKGVPEDVPDQ